MSTVLDNNGWTLLPLPAVDSRMIYVSNSGLDTNDGLSESTPKRLFSQALPLLRSGKADWVLLKCGDKFTSEGDWRIRTSGGPSATEISGISSYGTGPRPVLLNGRLWYGSTTIPLANFAIMNLDHYCSFRDPLSTDYGTGVSSSVGLQILLGGLAATNSQNWLIENNRWRSFTTNVQIDGRQGSTDITSLRDITIRRNVFENSEEFGLQIYYTQNAVVEENVFSRSGWEKRTVQLHNMYMSGAISPTIRRNIFSHGGNMSIKLSGNSQSAVTDFVIEDNVFNRGMVGLGHGGLNGSWNPLTQYSHERGTIRNNVMMEVGKNLPWNTTSVQAIGFNIGNINNVLFESNIFAHNDEVLADGEIFRFADPSTELSANVTLRNNVVWNWLSKRFNVSGNYFSFKESVTNLIEENNLPTNVTYVNPTADLAGYLASIGIVGDETVYMTIVCAMSKDNWDVRYTAKPFIAYMHTAFTVASIAPPPIDPIPVDPPVSNFSRIESAFVAAAKAFLSVMGH